MNASRLSANLNRLLAGACLAATTLVGCGSEGSEGRDGKPTGPAGGAASAKSTSPRPAGEAKTLAVPSGGPKKITDFPIPPGAKIVDVGPAFNQSWQFGISSPDAATTLDFYKTTLADAGYTLKEDASLTVGANTVQYDLAFFGKTYGVVDKNNLAGGTQVSVNDKPLRGIEP